MKKLVLSFAAVCMAVSLNAQDTLTEYLSTQVTGAGVYSAGAPDGYVHGNNSYGDKAKYQRFDAAHGLTGSGTITGCLLWVGYKSDAGGSFNVTVRDFTGGTLGASLGSATVSLASVDTLTANTMGVDGLGYNVAVTFATPIPYSVFADVLIGVELPTTAAAGDTLALVSGTPFADAETHSWEIWSNNTANNMFTAWTSFSGAGMIYPIIMNSAASVTENSITANVYPNPANDVLNVNVSGTAERVSILSLDGKVIATQEMNGTKATVNVANLTAGAYFYEVVAADGSVVRNTFMKK